MKAIILAVAAAGVLSGCVVTDPYYVQPRPVYVQPAPVYIPPRPVYVAPPPPRCWWTQRWNGYTRRYDNVKICR